MLLAKLGEILEALADAFVGVGFGGQVEEALIGGGVPRRTASGLSLTVRMMGRWVALSCCMNSTELLWKVVRGWMSWVMSIMRSFR